VSAREFPVGTVFVAETHFEDSTQAKRRPVVLIGAADYWRDDEKVCVCPITTKPPRSQDVPLAWRHAGLRRESCVRPRPIILRRTRITHRVGGLAPEDLTALRAALRHVLDLEAT